MKKRPPLRRTPVIAALSGLLTGIAAGFIGVGGGEFRIPVLVQVLGLPLKLAGGINLVVGLFTVALSVYRRWGQEAWTHDDLVMLGIMGSVSIIARRDRRRSDRGIWALKSVGSAQLCSVGEWVESERVDDDWQSNETGTDPEGDGRQLPPERQIRPVIHVKRGQ